MYEICRESGADLINLSKLGRELIIGCYLYILSAYVRWCVAEWEKEVLSLDS